MARQHIDHAHPCHVTRWRLALLASVTLAGLSSPGRAQTLETPAATQASLAAADTSNGEIVVTARKREESLLDTPAAITAFGANTLKGLNVQSLADVGKYVPNLNISRYGVGNSSQAAIFIRGIGLQDHLITTDPGVGVYLDGVYLGRQLGSNLSLQNIERVEVLRGPQGTLYGRNTLGGAVNIITRQPGRDDSVSVDVQAASRGRVNASFYADNKVSDTLAVSVSAALRRRAGVGDAVNIPNPTARIGEEFEISSRVAALWTPTEKFSLLASGDYTRGRNGQSPYKVVITDEGNPIKTSDLVRDDDSGTSIPGLESTSIDLYGASLTAKYVFDEHLSAKLLGSYRQTRYTGGLADNDTVALISVFPETGDAEQYSAELQLNGEYKDFNFVGGLYYYGENGQNDSRPNYFFAANLSQSGFYNVRQVSDSYAAYANGSYKLTSKLTLGAGVRYSSDDKKGTAFFSGSFPGPVTRKASYDAVTAEGNVSYKPVDNVTLYGTIQLGYQPGSFTPRPFGGPASFNASPKTTATNYEIGAKGRITPNWTVSLAAFTTDYSDRGLPYSFINAAGFNTVIISADARARGIEAETSIMFGGLKLSGNIGYLDSTITKVTSLPPAFFPTGGTPVKGAPTALSPDFTGSAVVSYTAPLKSGARVIGQVDYSYRGEEYGQPVARASEIINPRSLVGFNLTYEGKRRDFTVGLYGSNILNEVYDVGRLDQGGFVGVVRSNDRSEFGVRVTRKFGG